MCSLFFHGVLQHRVQSLLPWITLKFGIVHWPLAVFNTTFSIQLHLMVQLLLFLPLWPLPPLCLVIVRLLQQSSARLPCILMLDLLCLELEVSKPFIWLSPFALSHSHLPTTKAWSHLCRYLCLLLRATRFQDLAYLEHLPSITHTRGIHLGTPLAPLPTRCG